MSPAASNYNLDSVLNHINTKLGVKFDGRCLSQEKVTFTYKQVANIYIVYEIDLWWYIKSAEFTLGYCLFGAFKLNINGDPDKCCHSGYCIEFDARKSFSLSDDNGFGKNVKIFGADMSSVEHIDNKRNYIDSGLKDTTLTAEK